MRGKQPVLKTNTTTTPTSTTSNSTGLTKEEKEAKKQRKLEKQLLSGQKRKLDKSKDSRKMRFKYFVVGSFILEATYLKTKSFLLKKWIS